MSMLLYRLLPVLLLLLIFVLWRMLARKKAQKAGNPLPPLLPKKTTLIVLFCASLMAIFMSLGVSNRKHDGTYVPAQFNDGTLVPAYVR